MKAAEIMQSDDFKRCQDFHGHICPGLAIGYRASKIALSWLEEKRSLDEELVAVVENDACCVDAVQVLTGCTFGKGNFIYKDHGKMVFTFFSRQTGQGVRLSMVSGALAPDKRHLELIDKMRDGTATEKDKKEFEGLHGLRTSQILEKPSEALFKVEPTTVELPPKAKIEQSQPCAKCGEPAMPSKMERSGGEMICRGCLEMLGK